MRVKDTDIFGVSLDLLEKENPRKIRWISQFCVLTNVCIVGVENRDLNSRTWYLQELTGKDRTPDEAGNLCQQTGQSGTSFKLGEMRVMMTLSTGRGGLV